MPISRQYPASTPDAGRLAYLGGRGLFEQERDKFSLDEERFALQESEQDRLREAQNLQVQLSLLQEDRARRAQSINQQQFAQDLEARGYLAGQEIESRLAQEQMQQEGYALRGEQQLQQEQMQQEGLANRSLRKEFLGLQSKELQNQFTAAMESSKALREAKPSLSPEAWDQALGQYNDQFGDILPFPFDRSQALTREMVTIDQARERVQGWLGDAYKPGMESLFFDDQGEPLMEQKEMGDLVSKFDNNRRLEIDGQRQEEKNRIEVEKLETKELSAMEQKASTRQKDIVGTYLAAIGRYQKSQETYRAQKVQFDSGEGTKSPVKPKPEEMGFPVISPEEFPFVPEGAIFADLSGKFYKKVNGEARPLK